MSTIAVEAHRVGTQPRPGELERDIERVRMIARAMDTQFEIAGVKFGWDSIIAVPPSPHGRSRGRRPVMHLDR